MRRSLTAYSPICLLTCAIASTALTGYSCSPLSSDEMDQVFGSQMQKCNEKVPYLWCGPSTSSCNADCDMAQAGQRCNSPPNDTLQSSTGSITLCYSQAGTQSYCDTSGGNQTCDIKTDCICSLTIGNYKCKPKAGTGEITKLTVQSDSNCTQE